tara:strand:- start:4118 stop:4369 length:252 start_codon:yes stop_codon:yes gene_type:complete
MLIPVRCFTCGKVIGHLEDVFKDLSKKMDTKDVFDKLGIRRICCKRMLISHVDLIEDIQKYEQTKIEKVDMQTNSEKKIVRAI